MDRFNLSAMPFFSFLSIITCLSEGATDKPGGCEVVGERRRHTLATVSGDFDFKALTEGMGDLLQGGQLDILHLVLNP